MHRLLAVLAISVLSMNWAGSACAGTTYRIMRITGDPMMLTVSTSRKSHAPAASLILRGVRIAMGIRPQIRNLNCDAKQLRQVQVGIWRVPTGCRHLEWEVKLDPPGLGDASTQRSIGNRGGSFYLFSEASSLPRLSDASSPETLAIPQEHGWSIAPPARSDGRIALPRNSQAPMFVVFGKTAATAVTERLRVAYFVDDRRQIAFTVPIGRVLSGLHWLMQAFPPSPKRRFTYVWLGLPPGTASLGGATGSGVLLVNYIMGESSCHTPAVSAAPLIEAAHQLGANFGSPPAWVEESLATYLGVKALQHTEPRDAGATDLMKRMIARAHDCPAGLLEVQRQIESGNRSNYAAFFSKGVAFWAAVDNAMRRTGASPLESKIIEIRMAGYDKSGGPSSNLRNRLGLSEAEWRDLEHQYLSR